MTFIRVYIDSKIVPNASLIITGNDFFYLKNVMRIKVGKIIKIFNEIDGEFFATIKDITKKEIALSVDKLYRPSNSQKLDFIHLFVSSIRPHRMTWLIEKCVELGVEQITIVKMQNTAFETDFEKMNIVIKEATEQCERISKMKINTAISLDEFLQKRIDFIYLKERDENSKTLSEIKGKKIKNILAGPEGGFIENEFEELSLSKGIPVSLGELILRTETACIKAISVLSD